MLMPLSTADPHTTFVGRYCENNEYTNGSAFQRNLNQVLESLVRSVSTSGFSTSSVDEGQNSHSTVYGLAQCVGDLNSSDCKQCVANAKTRITSGTPGEGCNKTSASILLDGCFLRYHNHSFYGDYSDSVAKGVVACSHVENSQPEFTITIRAMLQKVLYKAANSSNLFAAEEGVAPYNSTEHIYSLAQCWRDLSTRDCEACLRFALSQIYNNCTAGALGSRFVSLNCYLRSEVYAFFNAPILSPSPSPTRRESPPVPSIFFHIVYNYQEYNGRFVKISF